MARFRATTRLAIIASFAIGVTYIATRLVNLTQIPIFTDEAIYIRWSQIGAADANWRFISLTDGKQPFFTWVIMVLLRSLHGDPLFVGRLASVLAGAGSILGIGLLAYELFRRKKIAFVSSLLYLVCPFALVYDRMALYDSMVGMFSIWSLYLAILLVRRLRLDVALLLGMVLGMGMLNKSSGFLSLYLLPATLLLFDWSASKRWKRLLQWVGLALVAGFLSQLLYSVLRLSPLFSMVSQKDAVFIYPIGEWFRHPFLFLEGNLRGLFDWLIGYLTWPIFFAAIIPAIGGLYVRREKFLLYFWWLAPFIALALFGRILYPRFIFFMTMPLLILAGASIVWLYEIVTWRIWKMVLIAMLFIPSLWAMYFIIFIPLYAPIPNADKGQYISDWPAGWGVREVNAFFAQEALKGHISVYTEGTFGLLPAAVEMYLVDNPNITIGGIWPLPKEVPAEVLAKVRREPTYLVVSQGEVPPSWPVVELAAYQKGLRKDRFLRLYRFTLPKAKT